MPTNQEQLACSLLVLQQNLRHNPMMAALAAEVMAAASQMPQSVLQSMLNNNNVLDTEQKSTEETTSDEDKGKEPVRSGKVRINRKRKQENEVDSRLNSLSPLTGNSSPTCFEKAGPCGNGNEKVSSPHKIRKLKLYSVEEKIDIIDYAKVIGNRAAGREFNVAESSIREWRKNEDRLKRQLVQPDNSAAANSIGVPSSKPNFEKNHPEIIAQIDRQLVEFINHSKEGVDWYGVRDRAQEIWSGMASQPADMSISMGWVARFMHRADGLVPKIAPPVIATANSMNSNNGSLSMVRCANNNKVPTDSQTGALNGLKKPKQQKPLNDSQKLEEKSSRRKSHQPRRLEHATLLTTTTNPFSCQQSFQAQEKMSENPDCSHIYNSLALWLMKNNFSNGQIKSSP